MRIGFKATYSLTYSVTEEVKFTQMIMLPRAMPKEEKMTSKERR